MEDLQKVFAENNKVLIDFYADWCGPCRMLAPVIEEIKQEHSDKVKVVKINVDENQEIAAKYGVRSIPTLVVVTEGKVSKTAVGFKSKAEILKMID